MTDGKEQKILDLLKKHKEGLTIKQISEALGVHRQTVNLHLNKLIGARKVIVRKIGVARLIYHRKFFPDKLRKETNKERKNWEEV